MNLSDRLGSTDTSRTVSDMNSTLWVLFLQIYKLLHKDLVSETSSTRSWFAQSNKHVEIHQHFIKERCESGPICIPFMTSSEQTADIFTKAVNHQVFDQLKSKLGMYGIYTLTWGRVLQYDLEYSIYLFMMFSSWIS